MIDLTGFFPAERSVEEDLPQQYGHGVPGPPLLATHLPELHRGKRTGQLALEEWHSFEQVWKSIKTLLLDAVKRNLNIKISIVNKLILSNCNLPCSITIECETF